MPAELPSFAMLAVVALAAYALGSVSFAIVVSRLLALPDPRSYGSKNPGATNVLRSGSKLAAVLTLAGDAGKGWLAVWLATLWQPDAPVVAVAAIAVFLGHLYPVFHRFVGGKGVATAAGVLFGIDWRLGLGTVLTWVIIVAFLRYSSLAALVAAAFAPLAAVALLGFDERAIAVLVMAAFLVWRHKANISRLLAGTEPRLGAKKSTQA
ncbi:MAG: glycerol-3-phosphate 1-O-acyltransferase PlsY [Clostridia bacterium]